LKSECGGYGILKWCTAQNSNKFQESRFLKEKSVEDMVTLVPTAQDTLVIVKLWTPSEPPT
jgi:hypothetical protein